MAPAQEPGQALSKERGDLVLVGVLRGIGRQGAELGKPETAAVPADTGVHEERPGTQRDRHANGQYDDKGQHQNRERRSQHDIEESLHPKIPRFSPAPWPRLSQSGVRRVAGQTALNKGRDD